MPREALTAPGAVVSAAAVAELLSAMHAADPASPTGHLAGELLRQGVNEFSLRGGAVILRDGIARVLESAHGG